MLRLSFPLHCETAAGPPSHHCQTHATYKEDKTDAGKSVCERDLINRFLLEWCFIKINWKLVTKQQPVKGYSDQRGKETGQCFFSNPRKWQEMTVTEGWTPLPTTGSWKGRAWPLWSRRQPCPIYPFNKHKAWSECMTARTDTLNNSNSPQRELQRLKHLACVYQIFWR